MWVLSQNGKCLIFAIAIYTQITHLKGKVSYEIYCDTAKSSGTLGTYESEERCKEIIQDMACGQDEQPYVYYMPTK